MLSLPSPSRLLSALFPTTAHGASAGAELFTSDGRALPLVATTLRAEARGGLARFVLEQTFRNAFAERLHVTYRMPLPADGAVSGYAFTVGERRIVGSVDRKRAARERFEQAVASGHTAGLLEQERQDIFTQLLGNVPPNETVVAQITVDAKLAWLPEGEWELRFPTVIGPRYIGATDTLEDARATHVKTSTQPLAVNVGLVLNIGDATQGRRASSPSHAIERSAEGTITLAAGARLDRDLVVRWPVATPSAGLAIATARPNAGDESFGLLTIVPPARSAKATPIARDLIVLLDTSGSMGGVPLDKAKAVVAMLIDTLTERDRFELIEFNYQPTRYKAEPEAATPEAKRAALRWVHSRVADGGTEIREGVLEALRTLRIGAQRQVIAVTDGYVGGEQQILRVLHDKLPASCRLHVLGVGAAVNRSLATALARVGRGAEVIVGPDEDPERSAKRLFDRTAMPMLTNVTISGDALIGVVPDKVPDVFEGAPLVAAISLSTEGGELVVRGETADGPWEQRTRVAPLRAGDGDQAICALYARERVADLEARALLENPQREIEDLGVRFQIATRFTSWVAVDESRVHAGPETMQNVPQEVPHGTRAQAFGLRATGTGVTRAPRPAESAPMLDLSPRGAPVYGMPPVGRFPSPASLAYPSAPPASYGTRTGGYAPPARDEDDFQAEEATDEVVAPAQAKAAPAFAHTVARAGRSTVPSEPAPMEGDADMAVTLKKMRVAAPVPSTPEAVPARASQPAKRWLWILVAIIMAMLAAAIWWAVS